MEIKTPTPFNPYKGGRCKICELKGRTAVVKMELPFDDRVVGSKRYYNAMQAHIAIRRLIRTPRADVTEADIVVIGDDQYRVAQAQYIHDTNPPSTDITLEILKANYEVM